MGRERESYTHLLLTSIKSVIISLMNCAPRCIGSVRNMLRLNSATVMAIDMLLSPKLLRIISALFSMGCEVERETDRS